HAPERGRLDRQGEVLGVELFEERHAAAFPSIRRGSPITWCAASASLLVFPGGIAPWRAPPRPHGCVVRVASSVPRRARASALGLPAGAVATVSCCPG